MNKQQPAVTARTGLGELRPYSSYAITKETPAGEVEIGKTFRKSDGTWVAEGSSKSEPFKVHRDAVEWLLEHPATGQAAAPKAPKPSAPAADPEGSLVEDLKASIAATSQVKDFDAAVQAAKDATDVEGRCGRSTSKGSPCKAWAGQGTDHVGRGACKAHDGQPLAKAA